MEQMPAQSHSNLSGRRILLVEDNYALARQMCADLRREGATVLGPAPTSYYAFNLLMGPRSVDGAVLDIVLHGDNVFELAGELSLRGIPIVFATGYEGEVPDRFRSVPRLQKPLTADGLVRLVASMLEPAQSEPVAPPPPTRVATENVNLAAGDRLGRAVAQALAMRR